MSDAGFHNAAALKMRNDELILGASGLVVEGIWDSLGWGGIIKMGNELRGVRKMRKTISPNLEQAMFL